MSGKLKRIAPRTFFAEEPPARPSRRRPRLASEPTSRHLRLSDRWEPGFLRVPGGEAAKPLSYVVDGLGIYWDATAPSELELMLQDGGWETPGLLARAGSGIAALRELRLSLDNDPRRADLGRTLGTAPAAGRVLVVDQPESDPTIGFALAGPSRFGLMLDAAIAENPGAEIVVIRDPAAPIEPGERAGLLAKTAAARGVTYVGTPVDAWSAIECATRIYVVASHLGFEAALAGRRTTCFGVPFYAGWGFTTTG